MNRGVRLMEVRPLFPSVTPDKSSLEVTILEAGNEYLSLLGWQRCFCAKAGEGHQEAGVEVRGGLVFMLLECIGAHHVVQLESHACIKEPRSHICLEVGQGHRAVRMLGLPVRNESANGGLYVALERCDRIAHHLVGGDISQFTLVPHLYEKILHVIASLISPIRPDFWPIVFHRR
jgi:hypothetical protein